MTGDCACEGGLLVFACSDGRLVHTQRLTGAILAHDGDAVHAVTALVKGTRLVESCRRLLHQSLYLHHNFTESPLLSLSLHLTHADGKVWAVCLSRGTCAAKRPRDSILPRAGEDLVVAAPRTHATCFVSPQSRGVCFTRPVHYRDLYLVYLSSLHFTVH